ncbi:hypothetical protein KIN20_031160 [Parelaphostrongylus tenuis]|uniref:Uncharacterized protein n=1 Tax=Parelaphostrongylus tenuis TaxID=148309 RepID=A0AAD5WH32_PARTN|nr:hypothetical protein KIN20_031160 [Parelaphostrongylus tenuis]
MNDDEEPILVETRRGSVESLSSECWRCIDGCIGYLECAEKDVSGSKKENHRNMSQQAGSCNITSNSVNGTDAMVPQKSSSTSRLARRQHTHFTKEINFTKTPVNKIAERCDTSEIPKTTARSTRRRNCQPNVVDPSTVKKKLRKGYVYELVPADNPQSCVVDTSVVPPSGCLQPTTYRECSTQTMDSSHVFSMLMEELVNDQAGICAGSTSDLPLNLPSHVYRRLIITQQLLMKQSEEMNRVCEENRRLDGTIKSLVSVLRKFRDGYATDLRHLRDSVEVLKREFSFYQDEFVAEANKSVDNIKTLKEQFSTEAGGLREEESIAQCAYRSACKGERSSRTAC